MTTTDILNKIINGEPFSVEEKFGDPYQLTPQAKVIWAMNQLPDITSATDGIFRRVRIIGVHPIPEESIDLLIKEKIMQEGPGILNWAINGLIRFRQSPLQSLDLSLGSFKITRLQMDRICTCQNYLVPISPLPKQPRRDPQFTLDLATTLTTTLEQFECFQFEFFRVLSVFPFRFVHDPVPILSSLLDLDIVCVHFIGATS